MTTNQKHMADACREAAEKWATQVPYPERRYGQTEGFEAGWNARGEYEAQQRPETDAVPPSSLSVCGLQNLVIERGDALIAANQELLTAKGKIIELEGQLRAQPRPDLRAVKEDVITNMQQAWLDATKDRIKEMGVTPVISYAGMAAALDVALALLTTPQAPQEDVVEQQPDERPHPIIAQPMNSADLERVTGMATLDVGIPYRAGGTIGLFPSTVRALLGHIAWLEQSKPKREVQQPDDLFDRWTANRPALETHAARAETRYIWDAAIATKRESGLQWEKLDRSQPEKHPCVYASYGIRQNNWGWSWCRPMPAEGRLDFVLNLPHPERALSQIEAGLSG